MRKVPASDGPTRERKRQIRKVAGKRSLDRNKLRQESADAREVVLRKKEERNVHRDESDLEETGLYPWCGRGNTRRRHWVCFLRLGASSFFFVGQLLLVVVFCSMVFFLSWRVG